MKLNKIFTIILAILLVGLLMPLIGVLPVHAAAPSLPFTENWSSDSFSTNGWRASSTANIESSLKYTGYSYAANFTETAADVDCTANLTFASVTTTPCWAEWVYFTYLPTSGHNYQISPEIDDRAGNEYGEADLANVGGSYDWALYYGPSPSVVDSNSTVVPISASTWYWVELDGLIGSSGHLYLYVNNKLAVNYTGNTAFSGYLGAQMIYIGVDSAYSGTEHVYIDGVQCATSHIGLTVKTSTVTLNSPSNGASAMTSTVKFNFTATSYNDGVFKNATLYLYTTTGAVYATVTNATAGTVVHNGTQTTIPYTFTVFGVQRLWNVRVFNTTTSVVYFASQNYTITDYNGATGVVMVQGPYRGSSTSNSLTVTMGNTPTSGDLLIAVIGLCPDTTGTTVTSITETGVTWTRMVHYNGITAGSSYPDMEIWAGVIGSGASTSISVSYSHSSFGCVADVCEWAGLVTTNFLDKNATSSGTGTTGNTGTTASISQTNELIVGGVIGVYSGTVTASSPTYGFTLLDGAYYTYQCTSYLYKIVSSITTGNSSVTFSASTLGYIGCIATFRASITSGLSVILNAPSNGATMTSSTVKFNFTASSLGAGAIKNATVYLWTTSGSLYTTRSNISAGVIVHNYTMTTIPYTFTSFGVQYLWNVKVWNSTKSVFASQNRTVTDYSGVPPQYTLIAPSSTLNGTSCTFSVTVSCVNGLNNYRFAFANGVSVLTNGSWTVFTANPQTLGITETLNKTVGVLIKYEWFFNSTVGYYNNTGVQSFTTTSSVTTYPTVAIIMGFLTTSQNSTMPSDPLSSNLAGTCSWLAYNHIQYCLVMLGYWGMSGGTLSITYSNSHPASFWQSVCSALIAAGVTPIALVQDGYTYNSAYGEVNIGSSYYSQFESYIQTFMNWGFKGYTEDIETWTSGSWVDYGNFINAEITYLHTGSNFANGQPRLAMPTFGSNWWYNVMVNGVPISGADYIIVQYFQIGQSNAVEWWDLDFGLGYSSAGGASFSVPSPIILDGSTESGLATGYTTVASQIPWFDNMIQTYAHPKLYSFGFYQYEDLTSADWAAWRPWITSTLPSLGIPPNSPPASLSVSISPLSATLDYGQSLAFSYAVYGGVTPYTTYHWYVGSTLAASTASFTFVSTTYGTGAGVFSVYLNVTDSAPTTAKSNVVTVTVNSALNIIITPPSVTINISSSQPFQAFASNASSSGTPPYTYKWYMNGTLVSGVTGSSYTFTPSSVGHYNIYVNVTDSATTPVTAKSNIVLITVTSGVLSKVHYFLYFQAVSLTGNVVSGLTWNLYYANGTGISYTQGQPSLLAGTYIVKVLCHGYLIYTTTISTSTYSNTTVTINPFPSLQGYINLVCFNETSISGVIIADLSSIFNFSLTGSISGVLMLIVPTSINASGITYNGTVLTSGTTAGHWKFDSTNGCVVIYLSHIGNIVVSIVTVPEFPTSTYWGGWWMALTGAGTGIVIITSQKWEKFKEWLKTHKWELIIFFIVMFIIGMGIIWL